ncbi:MAG: alpha/beta hydrolase [Planctomycetota bacterium]
MIRLSQRLLLLGGLACFLSTFGHSKVISATDPPRGSISSEEPTPRETSRPEPTHWDVRYGKYHRNVLDVYLPPNAADSNDPLPVFVFLHGGGWMAGDKRGVDPRWFLSQGMAFVSANYRFTIGSPNAAPYPAPMRDAARVVQYVRHRANDWNLDSSRIALSGSSAGAVMAMWVAYQDDMADPNSKDLVAKESTRVTCVLPQDTPTTFDVDWILKNVGGPKQIHIATFPLFRIQDLKELRVDPKRQQVIEATPVTHVSNDDPPTFLSYQLPMTPTPLPETADQNLSIHHPRFGVYLSDKLQAVNVPCYLQVKDQPAKLSRKQFLETYLLGHKGS